MQRSFKKDPGRLSVEIKNRAPYFDYQQGGTSRIPARTMTKVDAARERRIVDIINAPHHQSRHGGEPAVNPRPGSSWLAQAILVSLHA